MVQDPVVVALVENQYAVVLERRVELCERPPAIPLLEEVGEGVAEADDGVVLPVDLPVQPTPIRVDGLENVVAALGVVEGLGQHGGVAVDAGDLEAGVQQLHRVEAGTSGDVQHLGLAARLEQLDEEAPLALGPGLPIDELVPFLHEALDVLGLVVRGFAHCGGAPPEILLDGPQDPGRSLAFGLDGHRVCAPS